MVNSEPPEATARIAAIRDSTGPHLRWELQQVLSRVRPVDLSATEIAGLLTILIPAHWRAIGGRSAAQTAEQRWSS